MTTCSTCKHWRGPTSWNAPYILPPDTQEFLGTASEQTPIAPRPYGMCDRIRDRGDKFRLIMGEAELETHQDFGCSQWEAK